MLFHFFYNFFRNCAFDTYNYDITGLWDSSNVAVSFGIFPFESCKFFWIIAPYRNLIAILQKAFCRTFPTSPDRRIPTLTI